MVCPSGELRGRHCEECICTLKTCRKCKDKKVLADFDETKTENNYNKGHESTCKQCKLDLKYKK